VITDKDNNRSKLEEKLNKVYLELQKTIDNENKLKQFFVNQCRNVTLENCSICKTTSLSNITNASSSMAPDLLSAGFDHKNVLFIGIGLCIFIVIVIAVTFIVYIRRKRSKGSHEITTDELPNHSNEEFPMNQHLPINSVAADEAGIVYKSNSESTPTIPEITLKIEDSTITENNIQEIEALSSTFEAENNSNINY
jgi:hypothetical protein